MKEDLSSDFHPEGVVELFSQVSFFAGYHLGSGAYNSF